MISIVMVSFNKPTFIEPQYRLLKKYMGDTFTYYVYDNSNNDIISNEIKKTCVELNVNYFKIPQNIHTHNDPSGRAGMSLDYAIKHNIDNYKPKKMIILDSDMFLMNNFNFNDIIDDCDIVGIYQERNHVFYYTNQLLFLNLEKLPNFENETKFLPGIIDGENTDCGGYLYYYLQKYDIKHKNIINRKHSGTINRQNITEVPTYFKSYFENELNIFEKSFAEYFDKFLHFRAGSNWINFNIDLVKNREYILLEYINNNLKF